MSLKIACLIPKTPEGFERKCGFYVFNEITVTRQVNNLQKSSIMNFVPVRV